MPEEFRGHLYFIQLYRNCERLHCVQQTLRLINRCILPWLQLLSYPDSLAARVRASDSDCTCHLHQYMYILNWNLVTLRNGTSWSQFWGWPMNGRSYLLGLWVMEATESPRYQRYLHVKNSVGWFLDQVLSYVASKFDYLTLLGNLLATHYVLGNFFLA